MDVRLELDDTSDENIHSAILDPLITFNRSNAADPDFRALNVLLCNTDQSIVGGLWAQTAWGWLTLELLYVPDELRVQGIGKRILDMAETEAVRRGCHGALVDTHSWQARGFYTRLGYEVFGELPDYPKGHSRYFLRKQLQALE